jgi:hypothetical protein
MPAARARKRGWATAAAARAAVVQACEAQFESLFGVPFDPAIKAIWRAEYLRLQEEDGAARRAMAGGRVSKSKAVAILKKHGLDPDSTNVFAFEGHAPTLYALYDYVTHTGGADTPPSIRGLREEFRPPWFNGTRPYVVAMFEVLSLRNAAPAADGPEAFGRTCKATPRYLTDHELAVISILIDPTVVTVTSGDVQNGTTVGRFIDRERKAIEDVRAGIGELRTTHEKRDYASQGLMTGIPRLPGQ